MIPATSSRKICPASMTASLLARSKVSGRESLSQIGSIEKSLGSGIKALPSKMSDPKMKKLMKAKLEANVKLVGYQTTLKSQFTTEIIKNTKKLKNSLSVRSRLVFGSGRSVVGSAEAKPVTRICAGSETHANAAVEWPITSYRSNPKFLESFIRLRTIGPSMKFFCIS